MFLIESISNPREGVEEAVFIAGDKRGTIYGIYEFFQANGGFALVLLGRCARGEKRDLTIKKEVTVMESPL